MKKSIIALMALFTLVACSEDSYQEADKMIERDGVNQSTDDPQNSTNSVTITPTMNYQSPYDYGTFPNYNIRFEFNNQTPFVITLTPYLGPIAEQVHSAYLMNPSSFPNFLMYSPDVNALPSMKPFNLNPFSYSNVIPCGMATPVIPTPGCGSLPFLFDYGHPSFPTISSSEVTPLAEASKVYYYYFEVSSERGVIHSGYLKQKIGDDSWDWITLESNSLGDWVKFGDYPALYGTYGTVVMRNVNTGELALSQERGYPVFPSFDTFTDPITSTSYTIEFRTELNKIVLEAF